MRRQPFLASRQKLHGDAASGACGTAGPSFSRDGATPSPATGSPFTVRALTRLTGDHDDGVNATLQARFSSGLPWKIHVTTYDTPQQANATGTSNSLPIPTQFRDHQLATMEATYADGSNAGPSDWTTYQEYNVSFNPGYENNTITLTDKFLGSLRDGAPVTLKSHFYSDAPSPTT
ncbi:hypothetical protein ACFT7S_07460 [Streptomyces sp. NPDC057136]|uniref:hypothetical protein n=1 Tax=Streptomyces sp. NPDC057136 TaxID=3346029 RepID=UPI003640A354